MSCLLERLIPEKGIHYLIDAFRRIKTDFELVIVGGDPFDENYEKSLKSMATRNIRFLGFIYGNDYEELCKGAYVYVTPSTLEGTSPALVAAMGYGNCVLISDIPGNLEVVGDAGLTFKAENTNDLRNKMEHLLNDQEIVESYREKAVKRVKAQYDWNKIADQMERIYVSMLK